MKLPLEEARKITGILALTFTKQAQRLLRCLPTVARVLRRAKVVGVSAPLNINA